MGLERARLMTKLRDQARALDHASRLKDEFLATLSHELRNPLSSIMGYADVLRRRPDAQPMDFVLRAAGIIHRNATAQAQLISDLLDLSRVRTGKLEIVREAIILAPAIAEVVEGVRAEARSRDVTLDLDMPAEPLTIFADPVRVQQVVWNLLNNAIKFTPAGGRVTLS